MVKVGDKIAQLILEKCATLDVQRRDKLADMVRADKGFVHSGVREIYGLNDWYAYRPCDYPGYVRGIYDTRLSPSCTEYGLEPEYANYLLDRAANNDSDLS